MYKLYMWCIGLDEMMGEMVAVICGVVINYFQQEETNKVAQWLNLLFWYPTLAIGTKEAPVTP